MAVHTISIFHRTGLIDRLELGEAWPTEMQKTRLTTLKGIMEILGGWLFFLCGMYILGAQLGWW